MTRLRSYLLPLLLLGAPVPALAHQFGMHARYFVDETAALTAEQVAASLPTLPWKELTPRNSSFGQTTARVWVHFRLPAVVPGRSESGALFLEVPSAYIGLLELHEVKAGRIVSTKRTGLAVPVAERDPSVIGTGFHAFRFLTNRDPDADFLLSAESPLPLALPLRLWNASDYPTHHWYEALVIGLYLGCLLIAAFYNAFLAISLRSRLYGTYALFVVSMVFIFMASTGLNVHLLYPASPWWALRDMHVWSGVSLLFYSLFAREFLSSRRLSPWLDRLLLFLVLVSGLRSLWVLFELNNAVSAAGVMASALSNVVVLAMAVKALRSGERAARYFFWASLSFNLFIVAFLLQELNAIWLGTWMPWGPFLGTLIEISLLSLALADRIRDTQRELSRQKAAVVHADKMGALGRMAGEIAHEINNPLAIIHGNAVLMRKHLESASHSPAEVARLAETIEATTMRITKVVKSMRSLARDSRRDPLRSRALRSIVQDSAAICQDRFVEAGVRLDVGAVPDGVFLSCRASEISQVLVNLLMNALDALKAAGAEGWVRVEVAQKGKFVEVAVVDSGPGVPKDIRARIHEPFFTTKEAGSGLGLGLSISRTIIEEGHGGRLWLDETSQNTRFAFQLPASPVV